MADKKGESRPIIIVKRYKKVAGGHHGGAWKVAYADFVTAMMAFFLVMWLVTAVSKEQRAAMFDYFKNPSMEPGKSVKPAPGQMGPGGASTSAINLGGGLDAPRTTSREKPGIGTPVTLINQSTEAKNKADKSKLDAMALAEADSEREKKRLDALMQDLKEAIGKSQALEPFKDQLLLDITPEGLRIQIVDAQNRPMFDLGSSHLKAYTTAILKELTPYLSSVPNKLSLTGHTDTTPWAGITGYTNWDLSTDRANAARRALEAAGLQSDRVARVVGLSSSVLFDKANPKGAINRRISIIVMTREAEQDAIKTEVPLLADAGRTGAEEAPAAAAPAGETTVGGPDSGLTVQGIPESVAKQAEANARAAAAPPTGPGKPAPPRAPAPHP